MEFKDKVIAFIDILGWSRLVENTESGAGVPLAELLRLLECLGTGNERAAFERTGSKWCPSAQHQERNLDFQVSQVSDCAIVSAEISPAGVINLLAHCWAAVLHLLEHGIMCRGYIKIGRIYHTEKHFIGTGYQGALAAERSVDAFKREADERGTPFVQIDRSVSSYIERCGDACVQEIFLRMARVDGEVAALFPFQRLKHHVVVQVPGFTLDAERQKQSNSNVRNRIRKYRASVESHIDIGNPDAVAKSKHYLAALDAQLAQCDETERLIDAIASRNTQQKSGSDGVPG